MPILKKMLLHAAEELKANSIYLSELDSVAGDGDHGITIGRMAEAMKKHLETGADADMKELLENLGMIFMGINGGSAGPLWGTVFSGFAEGIDEEAEELDADGFKRMFAAAQTEFEDISKAKLGDKTMVDALYPAIAAAQTTEGSLTVVMQAIAKAAEDGAEHTKELAAKFGRAKNMGERSIGYKDPGAVSISILFRSMAEAAA